MGKIIQIANYLAAVAEELKSEEIEYKQMATGFDVCHCENCGRRVTHLVLSAEGFFHCDPCQFMHIRSMAVQERDGD